MLTWLQPIKTGLAVTFALMICCIPRTGASYVPNEGRISKKVGVVLASPVRGGGPIPTSYGVVFGGIGDMNERGSLLLDLSFRRQRFFDSAGDMEATLDSLGFDLGYRQMISADLWGSAQLGSLYPWNVTLGPADLATSDPGTAKFKSLISVILGLQIEAEYGQTPVVYSAQTRKYINGSHQSELEIELSMGVRFGL